jgi:LysM repeat protein
MKRFLSILLFFLAFGPGVWAQEDGGSAPNRVVVDGRYFYVHTVRAGETRYSLGRKYGVSEEEIIRYNPSAAEGLRAGETLRIPAPAPEPVRRGQRRRMEQHTVNTGENSYRIARRYGVTVDELIASNPGLDPTRIVPGQLILIPREAIGSATPGEINAGFAEYTEALDELDEQWDYHLVEREETFWSLNRDLGISEDSLRRYNPQELAAGLRVGALLRYPHVAEPDIQLIVDHDTAEKAVDPSLWQVVRQPRPIDTSGPLRIDLMLPFTERGVAEASMADIYKGVLLALEDLKAAGISADLSLFDTGRSPDRVRAAFENGEFADADLIIGPWSEDEFAVAAGYARRDGIPIVSPQTAVETGNPFVFQARPAAEYQYDKLKPFLTGDYNVVLITPASGVDVAFRDGIEPLLPPDVHRVSYTRGGSSATIRGALSRERDNVVIVPTMSENMTDAILATLASLQNNITATTGSSYPLQVIGSGQWARFRGNKIELFFNLQAMYTTLYYADRTDPAVEAFDRRYLAAFGTLPTAWSYRGYDVAKLFPAALHAHGGQYADYINRIETPLLQVRYHFTRDSGGQWVNDEWVLVRHRGNYIIDVQ